MIKGGFGFFFHVGISIISCYSNHCHLKIKKEGRGIISFAGRVDQKDL